jgi:hypothetical protein
MTFKKWSSERAALYTAKPGDKDAPKQPEPATQQPAAEPDKKPAERLPPETS